MKSHARTKKARRSCARGSPAHAGSSRGPDGDCRLGRRRHRAGCRLDPRYLPHTPDAVEGWYRSCLDRRARRRVVTRAATAAATAQPEGPLASAIAVAWQQTAIRTIFAETVPTPAPPVGAMYLSFMSLAVHDAARRAQRQRDPRGRGRRGDGRARRAARVLPGVPGSARRRPRASLARVPDGRQEAEGVAGGRGCGRPDDRLARRRRPRRHHGRLRQGPRPGRLAARDRRGDGHRLARLPRPGRRRPARRARRSRPARQRGVRRRTTRRSGRSAPSTAAVRTAEQTAIAQFFSRNPVLEYRDALCRYLESEPLGLLPTTRLFARIDAAQVTAFIQTWRLKYDVGFWRPFQAIAAAESDGNPGTLPHPATWAAAGPQPVVLRLHQRTRGRHGPVRRDPAAHPRRRRAAAAEVGRSGTSVRHADRPRARRVARPHLGRPALP